MSIVKVMGDACDMALAILEGGGTIKAANAEIIKATGHGLAYTDRRDFIILASEYVRIRDMADSVGRDS